MNLEELKKNKVHFPVLIREVLEYLNVGDSKTYVDCTFGGGSYSEAILKTALCKVIAIDRDEHVIKYANIVKEKYQDRFMFMQNTFSNIKKVVTELGFNSVDGIVMDLGVSTMQISEAERGFSFQKEGPLLMQMGLNSKSAFDFVNKASEETIAEVLYIYGEERKSRKIAKAIVEQRKRKVFNTTKDLADLVNKVLSNGNYTNYNLATRTFQAIRIYINDELNQLVTALNNSVNLLNKNGRLIVVTFHSLEDRIVKHFFNDLINKNYSNITQKSSIINDFKLLTKKVVLPKPDEVKLNFNSSSAKLRAIEKL